MMTTVCDDDDDRFEFSSEDREMEARRLKMYSDKALKIGLPVDQMFINHPAFSDALAALDRIFQLSTKVDMPHGMRLIGSSGTGKTSLLKYFQRSLPKSSLFAEGLGAIYVRVPMNVSTPYLVSRLLRIYGYPFRRVTWDAMEQRITVLLEAIRQKGTQLIMFDEAHNLAPMPGRKKSSQEEGTSPTDFIRLLMDEALIGTVFSGINALEGFAELDQALASRVVGCHRLDLFKYDATWIGLLRGFVQQSNQFDIHVLLEKEVSLKLFKVTEGNLRSLKRLLTEIVLVAVDSGAAKAEIFHIQKAYSLIYGAASLKENPFGPVSA
ncbi:TniB family NTP-binding protein [Rhodoferax sp. BLA1]|uniref:TniB family NTP-binding protein n=1 Tax=Rhodoferax sp. BLA1 TaxID=2576062 RepID=UPI0015D2F601|nr:TniB family NTP-binding protein [Rhodoferax sp. BLA1]